MLYPHPSERFTESSDWLGVCPVGNVELLLHGRVFEALTGGELMDAAEQAATTRTKSVQGAAAPTDRMTRIGRLAAAGLNGCRLVCLFCDIYPRSRPVPYTLNGRVLDGNTCQGHETKRKNPKTDSSLRRRIYGCLDGGKGQTSGVSPMFKQEAYHACLTSPASQVQGRPGVGKGGERAGMKSERRDKERWGEG